jgi:hypothetical protein
VKRKSLIRAALTKTKLEKGLALWNMFQFVDVMAKPMGMLALLIWQVLLLGL